MLYRLAWIVLSLIVVTALSGCLVDKKKLSQITKISRTTTTLHTYQANEFIDYNVLATVTENGNVTTSSGTMRVLWEGLSGALINPIEGTPISSSGAPTTPILKETTTLTYNSGTEPDNSVIRYISQDSNGNITLHAIEAGGELYWPTNAGNSNKNAPVASPVIFGSPMTVGSSALPVAPVEFFVMAGCGDPSPPAPCSDELYRFSDNLSVVDDSTEVTTNLGIFKDPFELNYGGGIVTSSSALAVDVIGDIRDICGSSSDTINHGDTAGIGKLYIMPEIGIIQMQNTCTVTGINTKTVYYSVTLDNTSIPTPW